MWRIVRPPLLEELSLEAILAADPDYIFVVLQGSDSTDAQETLEKALLSNPAWGSLKAVQEGAVPHPGALSI